MPGPLMQRYELAPEPLERRWADELEHRQRREVTIRDTGPELIDLHDRAELRHLRSRPADGSLRGHEEDVDEPRPDALRAEIQDRLETTRRGARA